MSRHPAKGDRGLPLSTQRHNRHDLTVSIGLQRKALNVGPKACSQVRSDPSKPGLGHDSRLAKPETVGNHAGASSRRMSLEALGVSSTLAKWAKAEHPGARVAEHRDRASVRALFILAEEGRWADGGAVVLAYPRLRVRVAAHNEMRFSGEALQGGICHPHAL